MTTNTTPAQAGHQDERAMFQRWLEVEHKTHRLPALVYDACFLAYQAGRASVPLSKEAKQLGTRITIEALEQERARGYREGRASAAAGSTAATGAAPDGYVLVPRAVLDRAQESLGNLLQDYGWSQADMDASDELGAWLAASQGSPAAPQPPAAQVAEEAEPVAWATHHDEPLLFPTEAEARAYCEDDEQPIPLYPHPAQAEDKRDAERFRELLASPSTLIARKDAIRLDNAVEPEALAHADDAVRDAIDAAMARKECE